MCTHEERKSGRSSSTQVNDPLHIRTVLHHANINICCIIDRHINDRDHPAFVRLFGAKVSDEDAVLTPLRPVQDVIQKLLWDKSIDKDNFSFVYEDRYDGLKEMPGSPCRYSTIHPQLVFYSEFTESQC